MDRPLILDRYRSLAELAEGGYGEVVLAYDTRMQRRVAIKRLPFPRDRAGRAVAPVGLAEARTAALLNHPHIVTVHEWDTDSDEAFIIMEYVDGPSVADLIDSAGPLGLDEIAAIVEGVSSAVRFAHHNGVLHLDIKPENVLITRDGRVKVTDFGVAALSTSSGHQVTVGGTLGYMPLEQLHADDVDERTDLWAFASLVFELLTGANPFASTSIEGAVFKAQVMDVPLATEFDSTLSPAFDNIFSVALAVHAADRYPDVTEFTRLITPHLGDPAVGRELLAELAEEWAPEGVGVDPGSERVAAWDRLMPFAPWGRRALGAGVSAWLAAAGLHALGPGMAATAGGAALAALAGLLAPGLGAALGLSALLVALGAAGWWVLAGGLWLTGALVWWYAGKRGAGFAGALATPALGSVFLAPSAPLLLGFTLPPLRSAALAAYAAGITMLASAASSGRAPYLEVAFGWLARPVGSRVSAGGVRELLSTPAPLVVIAAWAFAAWAMSLACARASRGAAVAGASIATAALVGGYAGAQLVSSAFNGSVTWSGDVLLPHLAASLILVVVVIAAGPPTRPEEE